MPDELRDVFKRSAAQPSRVPDAQVMWRRGRTHRAVRAAVIAGSVALAIVGAGFITDLQFDRLDRSDKSVIQPAGTDRDDSRATVFVLHAFLANGRYFYDYLGTEQSGSSWTVEFKDGPIIEVVPTESGLRVERVSGPRSQEIGAIIGYEESASAIPTSGPELFDVIVERGNGNEYGVEARSFWAGPIPSHERADCRLEVRGRDGRLLYRDPSSVRDMEAAPPTEDQRDGGALGMGFELDRPRPPRELTLDYRCKDVRPGHFMAFGDTTIHAVGDAPRLIGSGGGARLDPARHVVVSSKIDWRGRPASALETICIAHVFGYDGKEIDAHGTTLYASGETEAQIERRSEGDRVAIAVDVGDPDLANYATIECRPTVPGVLFGPDQEG